jgi:hypothetical protein
MSAVAKTFTNGIALGTQLPFPQTRGLESTSGTDLWGGRHWQCGGNEVAVVPFNDATSPRHGQAGSDDYDIRQRVEISYSAFALE